MTASRNDAGRGIVILVNWSEQRAADNQFWTRHLLHRQRHGDSDRDDRARLSRASSVDSLVLPGPGGQWLNVGHSVERRGLSRLILDAVTPVDFQRCAFLGLLCLAAVLVETARYNQNAPAASDAAT